MAVIAYIDVHVKMEENAIPVTDIASVYRVLRVIDANLYVLKAHLDICAYKNVNVALRTCAIREQVEEEELVFSRE